MQLNQTLIKEKKGEKIKITLKIIKITFKSFIVKNVQTNPFTKTSVYETSRL